MDELLNRYVASALEYASAVQELRSLSQTRHTRSAYLAALDILENAWQECELARLGFRQPRQRHDDRAVFEPELERS
jgi:hypothetical protein